MKQQAKAAGGALLGLVVLYGIARGSLAEYTPPTLAVTGDALSSATGEVGTTPPGAASLLRLSWRTRGESVHSCRRLSPAEIEALPTHMRREEVCETRIPPWYLEVEVDGVRLVSDTVLPAGARQDRPLYIYRDLPMRPGKHDVSVRFEQILPTGAEDHVEDEMPETNATPGTLSHRSAIDLAPGDIALITYDPDSRSLVLRQPSARDSDERQFNDEHREGRP